MSLGHATTGAIVKAHGWMKAAEAPDADVFEAEKLPGRDALP